MLPSSLRILVCKTPQDMRRSFDSLALVVQQELGENPQSGSLYVFMGKRPSRIKILWYDANGYCLLQKRLHQAVFRLPDSPGKADAKGLQLDAAGFSALIAGVKKEMKRGMRQLHS
jgi:transposase